jgi:hypothetical protein
VNYGLLRRDCPGFRLKEILSTTKVLRETTMFKTILTAAALALSDGANAQSIDNVYDAVRGEFNSDGYTDLAYIGDNPNSDEYFELIIKLSTGKRHGARYTAAQSTNLI